MDSELVEDLLLSAYQRGYRDGCEDGLAGREYHPDTESEGFAQWQADNAAALASQPVPASSDLVEAVARALMREAAGDENADQWCDPRPWYAAAQAAIAAIPQAGDAGEFVEWLEGEAETFDQIGLNVDKIMRQVGTDPVQSSGKLGDTLREAATTIRTLQARLDVETERCAKVAELYQRDVGDGDDTPLLEANRICQVIATAIRERNGSD